MIDTRPVCCEPCEETGTCTPEANCCLECHCSYEEEVAMPYLPSELQARLREEHRLLHERGYPADEVVAHGARELCWFRRYCPPEVVAMVDHDHHLHAQGLMPRQGRPRRGSTRPHPTTGRRYRRRRRSRSFTRAPRVAAALKAQ